MSVDVDGVPNMDANSSDPKTLELSVDLTKRDGNGDPVKTKYKKQRKFKGRTIVAYADVIHNRFMTFFTGLWWLFKNSPRLLWTELRFIATGFQMVYDTWYQWVTVAELTGVLRMNVSVAAKTGVIVDSREVQKRNAVASMNRRISFVVFLLLIIAEVVLTMMYGPRVWQGSAAFCIIIFDLVGHCKKDSEIEYAPRPPTTLAPGVSIRKLQASIIDILAESPLRPIDITFHGQRWMDHGVELECHVTDKMTDDHLRLLERHLQAGHGMISLIRDRTNAAAPTLRLFWTDPLAGAIEPLRRAPKSISCRDPFEMTRTDDAGRGLINVLGAHMLWVGRSGSGKSSGLWIFLDWLVDCYDAEVDGIDITSGPALGAYRKLLRKVAFDSIDAHAILDDAIALCMERNAILNAGIDADDDGLLDENWQISEKPNERARFIVVDEYSTLAQDADLRAKVERIYEIGRKARVHMIVGTPSANKKAIQSMVPINQSMIKIVFGVPFGEIQYVLGVGMADDGWRPDRFAPSTAHNPGDSGKAYVNSGEHGMPVVHRFDRLTPLAIRERNRDRRLFLESNRKLPLVLAFLEQAFTGAGKPEFLSTADILTADGATGWTAVRLAAELKDVNVTGARGYDTAGNRVNGYRWDAIQLAVQKAV